MEQKLLFMKFIVSFLNVGFQCGRIFKQPKEKKFYLFLVRKIWPIKILQVLCKHEIYFGT